MRLGTCVWISIGLAAAALVPGTPSAGQAPPRAELAETTVVRGSQPSVIPVRLPHEATVATTHASSPDVKVRGRGSFVGFALVPEDPETQGLLGGRLPRSANYHNMMMPILGVFNYHTDFLQTYVEKTTLPAGDYRLYLLPGSGPAEVTIKLHGLSGRTELRPTIAARYALKRPTVYSPPRVQNYYSGGTEGDLKTVGLIFQALWIRTDAHIHGVFQFCQDDGSLPLPREIAYGPTCPGGNDGLNLHDDRKINLQPHVKIYYKTASPLEPGVYGQGFYFITTVSLVRSVGHLMLWLSYD